MNWKNRNTLQTKIVILTCCIYECWPQVVRNKRLGELPEKIFQQSANNVDVFNFAL